jgi:signal transduction histidine kinase
MGALLDAFEAYSKGQLDHKVPERGVTELVTLERAVNRMAQDLAQSREALVGAERQAALGALVPVVAHNIRNPLAAIRATAQVHEGPGTPREVVQGLKDIRGTVDRLERWLSALLSYLNPLRLARVEVRLSEIVDQAVMFLAPRLEAKQIRLRRVGWDVAAVASLDVHLMEQAIYGLLSNAIEASPDNAPITLTVRMAGANVQVIIADRGPGMPFRPMPGDLHPGPTTKSYGSGLGIPFAFKICGLHQGVLDFAAREGGGTEVSVTLPAAQSAHATAVRSA